MLVVEYSGVECRTKKGPRPGGNERGNDGVAMLDEPGPNHSTMLLARSSFFL